MPRVDLELGVDIERTARVVQLEGIFDVPMADRRTVEFHFEVPLEERPWQVGLIVGPSGAGKTSVAKALFEENLVDSYPWHATRSVADSFGDELSVKEVTEALNKVGFSSPPSWLKPFRVLSNGEQFRATLARALVDERQLIVMDEFTSVIDRTVARIGSHAVQKAIRRKPGKQFVAVSCHEDIIDWLQPDWILEPHVGEFRWRTVQPRPPVEVVIVRARIDAWSWFAQHHYLSAELASGVRCFVGLIEDKPACFAAIRHFMHPQAKNISQVSRVVALPDYQGIGLVANGFTDTLGAIAKNNGRRLRSVTAHPALIHARAKSKNWKMTTAPKLRNGGTAKAQRHHVTHRRIASFEYTGPGFADRRMARRMWA